MNAEKGRSQMLSVVGGSFIRREPNRNFAQRNAGMRRGKSLKKDASRVPHGEALLMALFLQENQQPAKHPLPPIWELSFESR
jgi:hypothetical protein